MKKNLRRNVMLGLVLVAVAAMFGGAAVAQILSTDDSTASSDGPTRTGLITPVRPPLVSPIEP
jgi:hypothetical protein